MRALFLQAFELSIQCDTEYFQRKLTFLVKSL